MKSNKLRLLNVKVKTYDVCDFNGYPNLLKPSMSLVWLIKWYH